MDTIDNVYENGSVLKEAFSTAKPLDYEVLPHFDNILLEHPPAESSDAHGDNIYSTCEDEAMELPLEGADHRHGCAADEPNLQDIVASLRRDRYCRQESRVSNYRTATIGRNFGSKLSRTNANLSRSTGCLTSALDSMNYDHHDLNHDFAVRQWVEYKNYPAFLAGGGGGGCYPAHYNKSLSSRSLVGMETGHCDDSDMVSVALTLYSDMYLSGYASIYNDMYLSG